METKKNYFSYSQISKYSTCPKAYYYHYRQRLRERSATSFLAVGAALDQALNSILLDFKNNKTISVNYKAILDSNWDTIEINKRRYKLIDCTLVGYAKVDWQSELLHPEDISFVQAKITEYKLPYTNHTLDNLKDFLEDKRSGNSLELITENEHKLLNTMNWLCVRRKLHLMLDAFVEKVIPELDEVIEVQKKVEMSNGSEDFVGFIDFIAKFKNDPNTYIIDNKSSSSPYHEDKLKHSVQLSTYCYALGLGHAAYVVLNKNIRLNKKRVCTECGNIPSSTDRHKTCNKIIKARRCDGLWDETVEPDCYVQILKGEISQELQNTVIENISEVADAVAKEVFPRNLNSCNSQYGGKCPYMKVCLFNKEDDNLVDLNKIEVDTNN